MQNSLLIFLSVIFCSALFFCADLSGSSLVAIFNVSGCWNGKTLKSLSENRLALACASAALPAQRSLVEISSLGYGSKAAFSGAHGVNRQNHDQVSALFMEEGNYAR
jgi:hypothetical protein